MYLQISKKDLAYEQIKKNPTDFNPLDFLVGC